MKRFLNAVLLCYMKGKDNLIYLFIDDFPSPLKHDYFFPQLPIIETKIYFSLREEKSWFHFTSQRI